MATESIETVELEDSETHELGVGNEDVHEASTAEEISHEKSEFALKLVNGGGALPPHVFLS